MFQDFRRDFYEMYGVESSWVTLIGIDPGSETLGVSILSFDANFTIRRLEAATFIGSKLPRLEDTELVHGARHARIQAHYHNLLSLLLQYQPIAIACESPFFQAARPQAYGALTEVVGMIRAALLTYRPNLELNLIDPPTVKKAVGAKGNAGKDGVKNAIINHQVIDSHYRGVVPIWELDEHSLDAIAVVYGYFQALRGEGP
jgi:Holliday junction resolvasome RuvABC endonuclease subunit